DVRSSDLDRTDRRAGRGASLRAYPRPDGAARDVRPGIDTRPGEPLPGAEAGVPGILGPAISEFEPAGHAVADRSQNLARGLQLVGVAQPRDDGALASVREDLPRMLEHLDRKSTRLNSSHVSISYAIFCLR